MVDKHALPSGIGLLSTINPWLPCINYKIISVKHEWSCIRKLDKDTVTFSFSSCYRRRQGSALVGVVYSLGQSASKCACIKYVVVWNHCMIVKNQARTSPLITTLLAGHCTVLHFIYSVHKNLMLKTVHVSQCVLLLLFMTLHYGQKCGHKLNAKLNEWCICELLLHCMYYFLIL